MLSLQENGSFPRANTLGVGNTQRPLEKLIFERGMPSTVAVLSLIGNVEFPTSRRRKKLFPSALPSEMELNALGKKINKPGYFYFHLQLALGNKRYTVENKLILLFNGPLYFI